MRDRGVTGEVTTWMAEEATPLIARPARYLVSVQDDNTLTIRKANRDPVQSTRLYDSETPDTALRRLGYTRAILPGRTQPMAWAPQPVGGGLWTTAVATERQP